MIDKKRIEEEADAFFEFPTSDRSYVTRTSMLIFAATIAEMVRNEAINKSVRVKIGDQYGNDLNGHWFYLHPADDAALQVLNKRSMKL